MRTTIDIGRMRPPIPGSDPRCWCSLAVVLDLGLDPANNVYADVELIPSGDRQTCAVAGSYRGRSFGAWLPILKDDVVLVLFPRGDPAEGPVIVSSLWSGSDPPPTELGSNGADPPTNPVIVVGEGQTVRVICRAGATVEVVGDSPARAADPVTLSTPNDSNWSRLAQALAAWVPVPADGGLALRTIFTTYLGLATPPPTPPAPPDPPIAPWPAPTAAERLKGE